jgi:ATP-dependent DNA helicase PIF1
VDIFRKMLGRLANTPPRPPNGGGASRESPPYPLPGNTATPKGAARPVYGTQPKLSGQVLKRSVAGPDSSGSPATDRAFELLNGPAAAIMILGGAGTGKTTFLYALQKDRRKKQVFLAPTGVAALHLGGQTLHSFFGIPPRIINHDEIRIRARQRKLFRSIERMVIDEISMVRADLLDVVDRTLRISRERDVPFGGVQVVLVGDFFQLPPVVPAAEEDMLDRLGYSGPYSFDAKVLKNTVIDRVPFVKVHRQTDSVFVECLHRLRRGVRVSEALTTINDACVRPHRPNTVPVILTPTNARADAYNYEGLARLHSAERVYVGVAAGTFGMESDRLPVPETLGLKIGARVMAVRNDPGKRWVNGSVGTVTGLAPDRVSVRLDTGSNVEIERFTWEKIRYEWDEARARVAATVVGTYTQLPVVHAWAVTIHKAQGLTLEDARVDFDYGAFAPGQAYVAVSRSRSMEGLSLVRPIRGSEIKVDPRVTEFMEAFEA